MRFKQLNPMFVLLIVCLLFISCHFSSEKKNDKPLIITTIYPYELIVAQMVDTLFTVKTLIPPNASPHTWSPLPQDVLNLNKADLIISNGLGLETNLSKTLSRYNHKHIVSADLISENTLNAILHDHEHHENENNQHKHIGINPHIWTSPDLLTDIIFGLSYELGKRYPLHKDKFNDNARLMIMELNQVDGIIKTQRQEFHNPAIVTLHDAFVYFFKYFDIDFIGAVQPSAGNEPSPQYLKKLADRVKNKRIKSILIEPQMNPQPAEILAKELNLKILTYDDLGTTTDAKSISEFILWNWLAIKEGF